MARRMPAISIASSELPTSFMCSDLGATGGFVALLPLPALLRKRGRRIDGFTLPRLRGRVGRGLPRRQPLQQKDLSHPLLYRLCRKAAIPRTRRHIARDDRGSGDMRALPDRDVIMHSGAGAEHDKILKRRAA